MWRTWHHNHLFGETNNYCFCYLEGNRNNNSENMIKRKNNAFNAHFVRDCFVAFILRERLSWKHIFILWKHSSICLCDFGWNRILRTKSFVINWWYHTETVITNEINIKIALKKKGCSEEMTILRGKSESLSEITIWILKFVVANISMQHLAKGSKGEKHKKSAHVHKHTQTWSISISVAKHQ